MRTMFGYNMLHKVHMTAPMQPPQRYGYWNSVYTNTLSAQLSKYVSLKLFLGCSYDEKLSCQGCKGITHILQFNLERFLGKKKLYCTHAYESTCIRKPSAVCNSCLLSHRAERTLPANDWKDCSWHDIPPLW
jgi:hypothetical protein